MAIPLTQGLFALVDGEDYEKLSKYKWYALKARNTYYAVRQKTVNHKKQKTIFMHRQILTAQTKDETDHCNHCGLDNRKYNIRLCTRSQNQHNSLPRKNTSSRFKGVYWCTSYRKWRCRIYISGQQIYLGSFSNEIKAAKAYDNKAKELFGEFAHLNFGD